MAKHSSKRTYGETDIWGLDFESKVHFQLAPTQSTNADEFQDFCVSLFKLAEEFGLGIENIKIEMELVNEEPHTH
jgi:hypothetical protein